MKKYLIWIPLGIVFVMLCSIMIPKFLPPWNLTPLQRMANLRTQLQLTSTTLGKLKETLTIEEVRQLCESPEKRINVPTDFDCVP